MTAVKMPDEFSEENEESHKGTNPAGTGKVTFDLRQKQSNVHLEEVSHTADNLSALVAEDDPVNSKIITKRLEKSGHVVMRTVNGEECAGAYEERPEFFDVVLMDMQVCTFFLFQNSQIAVACC
jgi:PleD family two-component response regulator